MERIVSASLLSQLAVAAMALRLPWWLPQNGALHGVLVDHQLRLNLWVFVFLAITAQLFLLTAIWMRRRPVVGRGLAKTVALGAISLLFVALMVRSETMWAARYAGGNPAAMQVEVTGVQFAWYFRYPGDDAAFGRTRPELVDAGAGNPLGIDAADTHATDDVVTSELVLPAGREVDLRLRAQDVIHGFFVPEMRIKQNAMPGDTFHIHFTPQKPGTYAILCSQICGLGHYRMQATLRVVSEEEFAAWLRAKEAR